MEVAGLCPCVAPAGKLARRNIITKKETFPTKNKTKNNQSIKKLH
jgi:hypothetical protein